MSKLFNFVAAVLLVIFSSSAIFFTSANINPSHYHSVHSNNNSTYRPVVLLHGLLATSEAMSHIQGWLEQDFPGIYVHNVEIANGKNKLDSLLIPLNKQLEIMHQRLQADLNLVKGGWDFVGHSQGGLLSRSYIERYGHFYKTPIHNYISLAGVQDGQYGVPDLNVYCPDDITICDFLNDIMNDLAYNKDSEAIFQKDISFAEYWKSPFNQTAYLKYSGFLADVNNERQIKNATYRQNMIALNKAIFLHALEDHIVIPSVSELFQFFFWGQDAQVMSSISQSPTYQGDWIGLKTLDSQSKLTLASVNCTHQGMPREPCKSQVYETWIKPNVGEKI